MRKLVELDVDTDEAPVGEDVRRCPDVAGSGSPSPDSVRRSSFSFKPKERTLSSSVVFVGRAMRTDDRFVPTIPKDGARRAGRRQIGAQRLAMMDEEGAAEKEDINIQQGFCVLLERLMLWPLDKGRRNRMLSRMVSVVDRHL